MENKQSHESVELSIQELDIIAGGAIERETAAVFEKDLEEFNETLIVNEKGVFISAQISNEETKSVGASKTRID